MRSTHGLCVFLLQLYAEKGGEGGGAAGGDDVTEDDVPADHDEL